MCKKVLVPWKDLPTSYVDDYMQGLPLTHSKLPNTSYLLLQSLVSKSCLVASDR